MVSCSKSNFSPLAVTSSQLLIEPSYIWFIISSRQQRLGHYNTIPIYTELIIFTGSQLPVFFVVLHFHQYWHNIVAQGKINVCSEAFLINFQAQSDEKLEISVLSTVMIIIRGYGQFCILQQLWVSSKPRPSNSMVVGMWLGYTSIIHESSCSISYRWQFTTVDIISPFASR